MTNQTEKPQRKIVQIVVNPETNLSCERLYALCDDNTIWAMSADFENPKWYKIDSIPQENSQ